MRLCCPEGQRRPQTDDPAARCAKKLTASRPGQQAIQKELGEIKKLLQAQRAQPQRKQRAPFKPTDISIKGAPFLGKATAKVTMVEFTDYQCPFCRRHFTKVQPEIQKQYVDTGKVKYVMRQFPLVSIHPRATKASEAALCAGDQGKYWEVHRRIFDAQRKLSDDDLRAHAEAEELDLAQFDGCLTDGKYNEQVKADMSEGLQGGSPRDAQLLLRADRPGRSDQDSRRRVPPRGPRPPGFPSQNRRPP